MIAITRSRKGRSMYQILGGTTDDSKVDVLFGNEYDQFIADRLTYDTHCDFIISALHWCVFKNFAAKVKFVYLIE